MKTIMQNNNMPVVGRKIFVTMCTVMVLGLNVGVKGASESANESEIIEEYRIISEQLTKNINDPNEIEQRTKVIAVTSIKGWVEHLSSVNLSTRISAINNLKNEVGLDFRYDPNDPTVDDKKRKIVLERWARYSRNLEIAMSTKIPKLIERPTRDNRHQRAMAAMFLGRSAPHPGFLPMLRKVIANNQEDYFTKYHALTALTQIPHEGLVEFLIEQMDTDLAFRAWQQLRKLTRAKIYNDTDNWLDVKRKYEQWWQANKAGYVYERVHTMWDS